MAPHRVLKPFGLESFSFWFAKQLLELHPEWLPFLAPVESEQDGLKVRTLAIELPSQNPNVAEPLTIAVDLQRIVSVAWFPMRGTQRWHVDWICFTPGFRKPLDWEDCEGVDLVAHFVERFLAEEIGAIWTDNQPFKTHSSFGAITAQDVIGGDYRRGENRTVIRFWKGALDLSL